MIPSAGPLNSQGSGHATDSIRNHRTLSQAVGNGENALRYLGRYVFHTATGNRRLPLLPDGRLRWTYRDSQTHRIVSLDLEPFEPIRRFMQHVLPAGYSRVRYFGWLSPAARQRANPARFAWVRVWAVRNARAFTLAALESVLLLAGLGASKENKSKFESSALLTDPLS